MSLVLVDEREKEIYELLQKENKDSVIITIVRKRLDGFFVIGVLAFCTILLKALFDDSELLMACSIFFVILWGLIVMGRVNQAVSEINTVNRITESYEQGMKDANDSEPSVD